MYMSRGGEIRTPSAGDDDAMRKAKTLARLRKAF